MGRIIKKILTDLIFFFSVLICIKAEYLYWLNIYTGTMSSSSQEFQPEFCLSKNERSQDLVKDEVYSKLPLAKNEALGCYQDVDMKIPEINGADTKASAHTHWEQ